MWKSREGQLPSFDHTPLLARTHNLLHYLPMFSFIRFWNIYGSLLYCCYFLLSWGSGANPWGPEKEDSFSKPTHYDGMLEVVGVTGVVHMGQIQSGLRSAIRIAQGGHVSIFFFLRESKRSYNVLVITCKNYKKVLTYF